MTIVSDPEGRRYRLVTISCPTCGPAPTKLLGIRGGRYHRYGLGIESPIEQCRRCGLLFPNPFPSPLDVQEMYGDPEKYFLFHGEFDAKAERLRRSVKEIRRRTGNAMPSILDIGSGRGEFLEAARREGIERCIGLDLSQAMIIEAKARELVVLPHTAEEYVTTEPPPFDAVILNAVLEHVADPDSLIWAARALVRDGGVLLIDVPREPNIVTWASSVSSRLGRSPRVLNLSPTFPPYHVWGFNPKSIRALLAKHEIAIEQIDVRCQPSIPATSRFFDRTQAFAGALLIRVGNLTRTAPNMTMWARRSPLP